VVSVGTRAYIARRSKPASERASHSAVASERLAVVIAQSDGPKRSEGATPRSSR
jgi:hypothetical protein